MIISDRYKYIFIRPQKVGSTSIIESIGKPYWKFEKPSQQYLKKKTGLLLDPYHIPANLLHVLLAPHKLDTYYKFSFIRNPWDRMVSLWYYYKNTSTFEQFIHNLHKVKWHGVLMNQVEYIGEVDYIGRFENLQHDFNILCDNLNIERRTLGHHKKTVDRKHYSEYYNNDTRDIVGQRYSLDIEKFKYEF